jgi:hypothetical protein
MGITFRTGHGGKSPLTILQTAGGGAAFLDYDNDGWLDVLLVGERAVELYHNERGKQFRDVTPSAFLPPPSSLWMGCCTGDYNNDGFTDVYLTGYRCNALLRNNGDGTFRDMTGLVVPRNHKSWETSCAFADGDGDGWLDLYVARYLRFDERSPQFCTFKSVRAACPPHYYDGEQGVFYRNLSGQKFTDATRDAGLHDTHGKGLGVGFCDYDDDGAPDLYIANDGVPGDLLHNDGKGRFRNVGLLSGTAYTARGRPHAGMGVDWSDFDHDGRFDLIVTAFQHEGCSLYQNQGGGLFSDITSTAGLQPPTLLRLGFGVKFADFDNDGYDDLLIANGHVQDTVHGFDDTATYRQRPQLFYNQRNGTFREVSDGAGDAFRRAIVGRGICVGDIDNDGGIDALLVDAEGRPLLLRNTTAPRGNYLTVKVRGRGRRDDIGARVTLITDGGTQTKEIRTDGGYLSASDPRLHFGLGKNRIVQRLKVRGRSGRTSQRHRLPCNQSLDLPAISP